MILKKVLNLFLFLAILFPLNSCTNLPQIKKDFVWPVETFVKYETNIYKQVCTPADPDNLSSSCYQQISGASGSGSIVAKSFDGSYILTAAHMCDRNEDIARYKRIDKAMRSIDDAPVEYLIKHYVFDIDQFKFNVEIIGYDTELDTCIVFAWGLFGPALDIATEGPKVGDKIYNFAAPAGFFGKHLVPLFDGYYVGEYNENTSIYTVPVIGGSSGSPVVNDNGELIGLIYARHYKFHHIAISPSFKDLRKFVIDTINKDRKRKAKAHGLDKRRSIIIKFGEKQ